jgi:hypothetical protein
VVLSVLDAFEGFDPGDPSGSDYLRERIELLEERARAVENTSTPGAWGLPRGDSGGGGGAA